MGLCYYVHTPDDAALRSPLRTKIPSDVASRYPSLAEVQHALGTLTGYSSEGKYHVEGRWYATLQTSAGKFGTMVHYDTHPMQPGRYRGGPVWFEKGDTELVASIVEKLTRVCGTLILTCDADLGEKPLVVQPGMSVEDILKPWKIPPGGLMTPDGRRL